MGDYTIRNTNNLQAFWQQSCHHPLGPIHCFSFSDKIFDEPVPLIHRVMSNLSILDLAYPLKDQLTEGGALGSVVGSDPWGLEGADDTSGGTFDGLSRDVIPEIDIKVDSVAVTAVTKKLKAKWSPELGQDLNAYHNLDAEVELTSILSEQIALEIDQEILNDLVKGAKAIFQARGGKKVIVKGEQPVIDFAYASVCTIRKIKKGQVFSNKNIWVKRPGIGDFFATEYEHLLGKRCTRNIEEGVLLKKSDVER